MCIRDRNCNQEGGLFVNETAHACAGAGIASDVSRAKLRRGSLSSSDFMKASIFLRGNSNLLKRLPHANCFDVVGGVTQGEIDLV